MSDFHFKAEILCIYNDIIKAVHKNELCMCLYFNNRIRVNDIIKFALNHVDR